MRESKILKVISYCLIPILVLIICLSILYEVGKEESENKDKNENYFETDTFLYQYMHTLRNSSKELIYNNQRYNSIKDGEMTICFNEDDKYWDAQIKDNYYIIIYRDLAITNVELTIQTDTIEEIKTFISNNDGKNISIINGVAEGTSEIIKNKAIQYYNQFIWKYYSLMEGNELRTYIENQDGSTTLFKSGTLEYEEIEIIDERPVEWYTTNIKDFQIYSSYKEELIGQPKGEYLPKLINNLKPYENILMYLTPVSAVLLSLIIIYLIISIGHTKNKKDIDLNDLDKIPLEIILTVVSIIVCLIIGCIIETMNSEFIKNYSYATYLYLARIFCIVYINYDDISNYSKKDKIKNICKIINYRKMLDLEY